MRDVKGSFRFIPKQTHARRRLLALTITMALTASVFVTGSGTPAGAKVRNADPGITKDEIVIGQPSVLSGISAVIAQYVVPATNAYYQEINETKGGINGRKIKQQVEDAGTLDAAGALAAMTKLKDNSFVIAATDGTIFGPLAERFKIPTTTAFGTEAEGLDNKYAFPVTTYPTYQARKLLPDFILHELDGKGKKIAVVFEQSSYLAEAKDAFVKAAKKKGLDVVIEQPVSATAPQCAQEVANVQEKQPDITIPFVLAGGLCFLRTAGQQGLKTTYTSVASTWLVDIFVALVPPGYLDGSKGLNGYPVFDTPCAQEYQAIMRKQLPGNTAILTDQVAFQSYMAVRQLVMQLERAGKNLTRESFVKKLSDGKTFDDGCLPPVKYGPGNKRTGGTTANVSKVENNKIVTDVAEFEKKF